MRPSNRHRTRHQLSRRRRCCSPPWPRAAGPAHLREPVPAGRRRLRPGATRPAASSCSPPRRTPPPATPRRPAPTSPPRPAPTAGRRQGRGVRPARQGGGEGVPRRRPRDLEPQARAVAAGPALAGVPRRRQGPRSRPARRSPTPSWPASATRIRRTARAVDKIDWSVVGKRDAERLKRTKEIAAAGGLKTADDYFRAALVFQHSSETADYQQAHQWCLKAVELDPDLPDARWLAAATEDRYLMNQGKPQRYGTQFKKVERQVGPLGGRPRRHRRGAGEVGRADAGRGPQAGRDDEPQLRRGLQHCRRLL